MAYHVFKKRPRTKFGEWLDHKMYTYYMNAVEVANKLHCTRSIVCEHRMGNKRPTFSDIIAYCWVFYCKEDPELIWKMADILIKEK